MNVKCILNQITEAFFALDADWRFTYLNVLACQLLRRRRSSLVGKSVWSEFSEAIGLSFEIQYRKAMEEQIVVQFEEYFRPLDTWFEVRAYPSEHELYVYFRDISSIKTMEQEIQRNNSKQKETERLLRESQERYQSLKHYNPNGICSLDFSGRLLGVNPALEKLLGYTKQQLMNMTLFDLLFPEDSEATISKFLFADFLVDKQANMECRLRCKTGSPIDVHCTRVQILINGETRGLYAIFQDITERKKAETRLIESEENYRTLVESSLNVIAVSDGRNWLYMNYAGLKMFGASSIDDIVGQPLYNFLHPEDHAACEERTRMILNEGKQAPLAEQKWYKMNGDIIESEVLAVPMVFDNQVSVQLIIRDISDRKQAETLLIQSEKLSAIGQLAAGVAHEIRNPLTAIKGFLQLLHAKDDGANSKYFDILEQEVSRIEMIASEMLMLAKPQAMSFEECHVQPMLHSVVTLLEPQALLKNVEIVTKYEDVHPILCVEHAVKQVFVNLLKNAIESISHRGQITVRLKQENEDILVQIEDQGSGIPEELLTRMGQPFVTTKLNGTGLGLMVTKKIVENHRGSIDFTSQVGVGTIVSVRIPISSEA